jgi:outer membrane receptor protein involved in Fe transport
MQSRILTFFLLLVILPILIFAQGDGRVIGLISDAETGEPLLGANVIIVGTSSGAAADLDGNYTILNVDAGVYELKATFLGYQSVIISNVQVSSGLSTYIDVKLSGTTLATETVTIVAERELIKKDATSSIRTVSAEEIDNLPVRGVTEIIALSAGVVNYNGEIHVRGGREDEVGYFLEGASITNPVSGGRAITIANDAIEEIQVEAGGFSAEYGGSNSGVIRSQLRSGGTEFKASFEYITDNIGFQSADDFLKQDGTTLGAYWYGKNESSLSLGGPLLGNKVRAFYNFNYQFDRSQAKRGYSGFDYGNIGYEEDLNNGFNNDSLNLAYPMGVRQNQKREAYTHSGTITMDFQPIKIRLAGTYTQGTSDVGGSSIFEINNSRVSENAFSNGAFSLNFTHVLTDELFYKATAGYSFTSNETTDPFLGSDYWAYGDSVANADAGVTWIRTEKEKNNWSGLPASDTRYFTPTALNIYGWSFTQSGDIASNYRKSDYSSLTGRLDFTWVPNKNHYVTTGVDFKQHTIRNWSVRQTESSFAYKLANGQSKEDILYGAGVNNYGYDIYGEETDEDGLYAPHKPVEFAIYLQDKIELDNLIINVGLRYDYFDMDNKMLADKTKPEDFITNVWSSGTLNEAGIVDVPTYSIISPRLSAAFPITDRTVFHAGFGKYVQMPSLNQAYLGYHSLAYEMGQSFFFSAPTGSDLEPVKKTHYEVGFKQQLTDFMAVDVTGYYDDIRGQIYFDIQDTDDNSPYQSYNTKVNGDFATTQGIEVVLSMRRFNRVSGNVSFTYQDGRGTGSYPNSASGIVGAPIDGVTVFRPVNVSPLTYTNPVQLTFFLDYRFADNDGGWLQNLGVNFLGNYNSGHPYTRGISGERDMGDDARFQRAIEPLNASITPSFFNVDMKIDKTFKIWDKLVLNINLRVLNLFDTKNVEDVYSRSGAADDDGYLAGPGSQLTEKYGPIYEEIYNSLQIDYNGYYSSARQILLGFRLEY